MGWVQPQGPSSSSWHSPHLSVIYVSPTLVPASARESLPTALASVLIGRWGNVVGGKVQVGFCGRACRFSPKVHLCADKPELMTTAFHCDRCRLLLLSPGTRV